MTTSSEVGAKESAADGVPTAERVAALVSGIGTIGAACNALKAEGWNSVIAGNRITIDDRIFARFIDESVGMDAGSAARWVVYGIGDRPAVWIVGTGPASS